MMGLAKCRSRRIESSREISKFHDLAEEGPSVINDSPGDSVVNVSGVNFPNVENSDIQCWMQRREM